MINKDKLVEGPFGSDACYEQVIEANGEEVTTWLCFGSGWTSSTLMTEGSKVLNDAIETAPELYKDLLHEDKQGRFWLPATITIPKKGMVFLDGTDTKNWNWVAVRAIKLTNEEKESGKFPQGQEWKMDMQNKKIFGQRDFMDALDDIGFFQVEL